MLLLSFGNILKSNLCKPSVKCIAYYLAGPRRTAEHYDIPSDRVIDVNLNRK